MGVFQTLLHMAPEKVPPPESVHSLLLRQTMLRVEVALLLVYLFCVSFKIYSLWNQTTKAQTSFHSLEYFFRRPWKLLIVVPAEFKCFVLLSSHLLSPPLFSESFTADPAQSSLGGPSVLACLERRWPSLFVAFSQTWEKILWLSCNLSALFFSRQHQLAILGLYHCLTCLFSILIKKQSPLSLVNISRV